MERELWRRAEDLFHAALERPPEDRGAFLNERCGRDAELRQQVERLISADERAGDLLEKPLVTDGSTPGAGGSLVGRQCGAYRFLSLLGAGGMGEVYRAHDSKLGRDVAVKILPDEFAGNPERLARFRREARALASLNHPNIAAIYGLEESAQEHYLVLELVEGETLGGPLPLAAALDLACQIADALEATHERGIIHRDLKPSNVKVTAQGKIKVLDFGLAKAIRGTGAAPDLSQPEVVACGGTASWQIVGSPAYMSPEQARAAPVDQRTDIWAFGCVLYELLTGRRAFEGQMISDTIAAVLEHEPDWRALPAETPAKIRRLLRQCLEKDPNRRLRRIRDARAVLEGELAGRKRWRLSAFARQPRFAMPIAAFLLLLGLAGAWRYQRSSAHTPAPVPSVAVVPFANLSADKENEYFGDGLAEDISDALAKLPGLRVIPPNSAFRRENRDISETASKLRVATILEGSVRKSGSHIRVTTQLVRTADRAQIWSERYDREMTDVFAVQDEISRAIVEKLRVSLPGDAPLVKRYTGNVEAYNLYLMGRHSLMRVTPESLAQGKKYLEQAIALDRNYAPAYTGLAEYYWASAFWGFMPGSEALPRAKAAALAALKLDGNLAEAHAQLGVASGLSDFDWAGAEQQFRRALELNPASAVAHYYYASHHLLPMDRLSEALSEAKRAVELDPLSTRYNTNLGLDYDLTGQYNLAIMQHRRAIDLDPSMYLPYFHLATTYGHMKRFEEAIAAAQKACELSGRQVPALARLAWAYGRAGRRPEARALLQELTSQSRTTYVPPSAMVFGYGELRDTDATLGWLEKGVEDRDLMILSTLKCAPVFAFLHGCPRYQALLRKMNLPDLGPVK